METIPKSLEPQPPAHAPTSDLVFSRSQYSRQSSLQLLFYLTPFKVKQIETSLDEYIYDADDEIIEGAVDAERVYTDTDFNRIIEMEDRERYRVQIFMAEIDQNQKTIVFCANQDHALAVRNIINQIKISTNPNYCVRVTANDGKLGEQFLLPSRQKSIEPI